MATHEICDVLDVSQFIAGRSAYECVAYAAALLKFAGKPGQGPTGSALQASNLAQYWYGHLENGNDANNMNGMSLDTLQTMLIGMGLHYQVEELQNDSEHTLAVIRLCLSEGTPLIVCGAETGMVDIGLGDRVPYNWTPTGNHAIVVTGITPDGNLLVHDTANVDASGHIRPGPRAYDASALQIVSVTAVQIGDEIVQLSIDMPEVAALFVEIDATHWKSKATGKILQFGLLADYRANGVASLTYLGDVASSEIVMGEGRARQHYAKGVRLWDNGRVSSLDLYDGVAVDPRLAALQAEIAALQRQPAMPQATAMLLQIAEEAANATGHTVV